MSMTKQVEHTTTRRHTESRPRNDQLVNWTFRHDTILMHRGRSRNEQRARSRPSSKNEDGGGAFFSMSNVV
jgi:hypothetical protein